MTASWCGTPGRTQGKPALPWSQVGQRGGPTTHHDHVMVVARLVAPKASQRYLGPRFGLMGTPCHQSSSSVSSSSSSVSSSSSSVSSSSVSSSSVSSSSSSVSSSSVISSHYNSISSTTVNYPYNIAALSNTAILCIHVL
eukprot:Em1168g1a